MSPGTPGPARPRAGRPGSGTDPEAIPRNGGFTFAERPEAEAPDARIIWCAELDPGTLDVVAIPTIAGDPDSVDPAVLAPWLTIVPDRDGVGHAVLSDGWHRIRLDIDTGTLFAGKPVVFNYRIRGIASAVAKMLPLRRLLDLCRYRRFAASLFPDDRRIERWLILLRVHDALADGATQREIAAALFGEDRVRHDWSASSDSLRSRTRRLIREARAMAQGGYRSLLQNVRGAPAPRI